MRWLCSKSLGVHSVTFLLGLDRGLHTAYLPPIHWVPLEVPSSKTQGEELLSQPLGPAAAPSPALEPPQGIQPYRWFGKRSRRALLCGRNCLQGPKRPQAGKGWGGSGEWQTAADILYTLFVMGLSLHRRFCRQEHGKASAPFMATSLVLLSMPLWFHLETIMRAALWIHVNLC